MKESFVVTWKFIADLFSRHITPFRLLYWGTAIATFRHSSLGFATVEGSLFWGALSALAIDIAMLLAAERLRYDRGPWLIAGLVVASCACVYSQGLYMVSHAKAVKIASGAMWMEELAQWIIDVRVIVIPFLLPAQVVIFAIASQSQTKIEPEGATPQTKIQWCKAMYKLKPDAQSTRVAEAVSTLTGETVSVATASRSK